MIEAGGNRSHYRHEQWRYIYLKEQGLIVHSCVWASGNLKPGPYQIAVGVQVLDVDTSKNLVIRWTPDWDAYLADVRGPFKNTQALREPVTVDVKAGQHHVVMVRIKDFGMKVTQTAHDCLELDLASVDRHNWPCR